MATVLCLITDGFEEIETITPVDLLRRAGVEVTMATFKEGIHVTGRCGITIHADLPMTMVENAEGFDLLLIPGGPQVAALRQDGRAAALAKAYAAAGKPVAAICAAPLVLKDAGLLPGPRFACHDAAAGELPERETSSSVITDGGITTSLGAGTAVDFGLALVRLLAGDAAEAQVKQGIMDLRP